MKKLTYLIKETFGYYKKFAMMASSVYCLSILTGMILFRKDVIPINPVRLSFGTLIVHNSVSVTLIVLAGLLSFGILGNLVMIPNGVVLGRILAGVFNHLGIQPVVHYAAPHFLFETAAIVAGGAVSCETYKLFYNLRHSQPKTIRLRYALTMLCTALGCLILAAIIESRI